MTNTMADTLRELMTKYNETRQQWIEYHGTDKGFDEYFTQQVTGTK